MNNTIISSTSYSNLSNTIKDNELRQLLKQVTDVYQQKVGKPLSIGIMGKSGVGKSSFINALCQQQICKSGSSGGCTREIQEITAKLSLLPITFYDFPGIAESEKWDKTYIPMYRKHLDKMDFILWLIPVDNRSVLADEDFFSNYVDHKLKEKFIFIVSKSDNAQPTREWDWDKFLPSERQLDNINRNKHRIIIDFDTDNNQKVIPVAMSYDERNSKYQRYNFDEIFWKILFYLGNTSQVTDELDLNTSWRLTQLEMKRSLAFARLELEYSQEMAEENLKEASELLERLKQL